MAARLGRGFRVTPLTARLVVVALRHYADDLAADIAASPHPYQVRLWSLRGELVSELAVVNDLATAHGAFDAASLANPGQRVTLGQQARILMESGPQPIMPAEERTLLLPPPQPGSSIDDKLKDTQTVMRYHDRRRQER
ncbi:hypothetical protein SAMN05519103_00492 [Rhizobiales bacterium GAS113]|jgi:hypothetical protein|nr:hypothetical protein SAMN05519103_00492 [Rhizobiales bacterium GAS113]SEC70830.1 hypothetical protein SAMN05519104_1917 [Rhizobiales bacterium GAS188]